MFILTGWSWHRDSLWREISVFVLKETRIAPASCCELSSDARLARVLHVSRHCGDAWQVKWRLVSGRRPSPNCMAVYVVSDWCVRVTLNSTPNWQTGSVYNTPNWQVVSLCQVDQVYTPDCQNGPYCQCRCDQVNTRPAVYFVCGVSAPELTIAE